MEEKSLIDKIRGLTPNIVNDGLITKNKSLRFNYEAERKYGLSKYWGYSYPEYGSSISPKIHYKNCVYSLKNMESRLKKLFSGFKLKEDEQVESLSESSWKEEHTDSLFKDAYTGIINKIKSSFEKSYLLNELIEYQKRFTSNMNSLLGFTGIMDPKIERLVKLESPYGEEVIFSVSPDRYFRDSSEGVQICVADKGTSILGYNHLPILLQFKKFDSGDGRFRELHESLATTDFNPITREFPFIPTPAQINKNKFGNIIHENAEKGKYSVSWGAMNTIEEALGKGIIDFNKAEKLLPGLYSGEIVFEGEIIKDLSSKIEIKKKHRS